MHALTGRSLLLRSLLTTVLVVALTGMGSLAYTTRVIAERTRADAQLRLTQLLDTLERAVQAACFTQDEALAREIAVGLLNNSEVLAVSIREGNTMLAREQRHSLGQPAAQPPLPPLIREVRSPFDVSKVIGEISLSPDPAVIATRVDDQVRLTAWHLGGQLVLVGGAVALAMLLFVARPIASMSNRMHQMDPVAGDRLSPPAGHADTEIGRLANDINHLADRLVRTLEEERALRHQREMDERKYHAIFDNAESGIFILDQEGRLSSWNPAFVRLLSTTPAGADDVRALLDQPWEQPGTLHQLIMSALASNTSQSADLAVHGDAGRMRWLNITLSPIGDGLLQGVAHDVTALKEAEASARLLALSDPLTGLANRLGLEEQLREHVLRYMLTQQGSFALVMVNLDDFRQVNEGIGLAAGDTVLRIVTARLSEHVKRDDIVARLSADIFVVVLSGISQPDAALRVVSRIMRTLRQAYFINGSPVVLHASMGITLFPNDGMDAATLLHHAELAVDKAKAAGGNTYVFFDPTLAEEAERRRHVENDLRQAIRQHHFELHYQPVVDLQKRRLVGAEALIRWRHPVRGLVPPDQFIPLAEQTGLVEEIGLWVLDSACAQLAIWQRAGLDYRISLNVSGRQIPHGLAPSMLLDVVARHGVSPESLALEITEGVLLADIEQALSWLAAVHHLGFRVYLDDFGTGYSSLSYLKRFPVDTLKVDKSFVFDLETDSSGRTLVEAIVAMATSLGLDVVAEGVESLAQMTLLQQIGCRYAQGYHFSRPVAAEDFASAAERIAGLLHPAGR